MDRGQLTIEFILLVVVMLTILATVSVPLITSMSNTAQDTSMAMTISSAAQKLVNTAEEVSMAGCGSFKIVSVYLDDDILAEPSVSWTTSPREITGHFIQVNGEDKYLLPVEYPDNVELDVVSCPTVDEPFVFDVTVTKTCKAPVEADTIGFRCKT